ncbi:MAG TPA: hypothetical protein RMF84_14300, partial [Polyangiaceae bacterium LLY-WYZ-14_1]|nr:hypothetical protein [Polyangiaceae bacterium LLY-WYZ-14_1]
MRTLATLALLGGSVTVLLGEPDQHGEMLQPADRRTMEAAAPEAGEVAPVVLHTADPGSRKTHRASG